MIASLVLAVGLVAVHTVSGKLSVKNQYNVTATRDDLLQFNISDLFDLSASASHTCDVVGSPATIFTPNTTIYQKDLSNYHYADEPEIVELVTNTTFYAIYDNSEIFIQPVNLDAESFGASLSVNFSRPGSDAVCTDLAFNRDANKIYLVCQSDLASLKHDNIYIIELDATTGSRLSTPITIPQLEGNLVTHRLQIKIVDMQISQGVFSTFAVVYD